MILQSNIEDVADHIRDNVDLNDLPTDYGYHSLPLCIIDAVYSINAKYMGVVNVVRRYCTYASISDAWPDAQRPAPRDKQHSVSSLLAHMQTLGPEEFTETVFQNLQRTSTRNGILKGEAVYLFAQALERRRIEYVQDLPDIIEGTSLEEAILRIPGQNSGLSLRYFQMLAGSDDRVKPDRMILSYLHSVLGRSVTMNEAQETLTGASRILQPDFPFLTPRLLDNRVWMYQRSR